MITYELAVKLREAGWPQSNFKRITKLGSGAVVSYTIDPEFPVSGQQVCCPTLSELIGACSERSFKLYCVPKRGFIVAEEGCQGMEECGTPEDAVANLWLKLNKK